MKALRRGDEAIPWTDISVHRHESGNASITLTGAASELARARGVSVLQVSIAQGGRCAAAIVLASGESPSATIPQLSGTLFGRTMCP